MSMFDTHIKPTSSSKSYATVENASNAAKKVISQHKEMLEANNVRDEKDQFIITENENGRYSPVIIVRNPFFADYMHKGFAVIQAN